MISKTTKTKSLSVEVSQLTRLISFLDDHKHGSGYERIRINFAFDNGIGYEFSGKEDIESIIGDDIHNFKDISIDFVSKDYAFKMHKTNYSGRIVMHFKARDRAKLLVFEDEIIKIIAKKQNYNWLASYNPLIPGFIMIATVALYGFFVGAHINMRSGNKEFATSFFLFLMGNIIPLLIGVIAKLLLDRRYPRLVLLFGLEKSASLLNEDWGKLVAIIIIPLLLGIGVNILF